MGPGFTGGCSAVSLGSLHAAVPGELGSQECAVSRAQGLLEGAVPRVVG